MIFNKKIIACTTIGFILSIILGGCTHSSGKSAVTSLSNDASDSSPQRVKNDLTRSALILFKAHVEAYPMTGALIKTALREEGKKRGLSSAEMVKITQAVTEAQKNRSCFHVSFESGVSSDAVNLGYWGVKFLQNGKVMEGQFIDVFSPGFALSQTSYYASTYPGTNSTYINSTTSTTYYNSGTVCTAEGMKIDYMHGFQMKLLARYMKSPKEVTLVWEEPK